MSLSHARQFIREQPIFGILLFTIFFVPLIFIPYGLENYEVVKFPLFLAGVGWFYYQAFKGAREVRYNKPLTCLLALFVLWTGIATIASEDFLNSIIGFYPRFNNSFLLVILWVSICLGVISFATTKTYTYIIKTLLVAGLLIAGFGIAQSFGFGYYGGVQELLNAVPDRVPSLLGNPNFSSMFLAVLFPWALWFWAEAHSFKSQLYYFLLCFVYIWAAVLFASRGALLGFGIGSFLILILFIYKKMWFRGSVVLGGAAFCLLITSGFFFLYRAPSVITSAASNTVNPISERYIAWDMARTFTSMHPLVGVGPGNIQIYFQRFQPSSLAASGAFIDDVHNVLLNILVSIGIPGLLVFIGLFAYTGVVVVRQRKVVDTRASLSAITLIVFLVGGMFNPVPIPLWLLFGVCLAGIGLNNVVVRTLPSNALFRWSGSIVGLLFLVTGIGMFMGEQFLVRSLDAYWKGEYKHAYERAKFAERLYPFHQLARYTKIMSKAHIIDPASYEALSLELTKAQNLHPTTARSSLIAGNIYWYLHSRTGLDKWKSAGVDALQRELQQSPMYTPSYTHAAYYYLKIGELTTARKLVYYGLSMQHNDLPAWLILAKLNQLEGRLSQTVYAIEKAYALAPSQQNLKRLREQARNTHDVKLLQLDIGANEDFLTK